jgi:hypothetical protein
MPWKTKDCWLCGGFVCQFPSRCIKHELQEWWRTSIQFLSFRIFFAMGHEFVVHYLCRRRILLPGVSVQSLARFPRVLLHQARGNSWVKAATNNDGKTCQPAVTCDPSFGVNQTSMNRWCEIFCMQVLHQDHQVYQCLGKTDFGFPSGASTWGVSIERRSCPQTTDESATFCNNE